MNLLSLHPQRRHGQSTLQHDSQSQYKLVSKYNDHFYVRTTVQANRNEKRGLAGQATAAIAAKCPPAKEIDTVRLFLPRDVP